MTLQEAIQKALEDRVDKIFKTIEVEATCPVCGKESKFQVSPKAAVCESCAAEIELTHGPD